VVLAHDGGAALDALPDTELARPGIGDEGPRCSGSPAASRHAVPEVSLWCGARRREEENPVRIEESAEDGRCLVRAELIQVTKNQVTSLRWARPLGRPRPPSCGEEKR